MKTTDTSAAKLQQNKSKIQKIEKSAETSEIQILINIQLSFESCASANSTTPAPTDFKVFSVRSAILFDASGMVAEASSGKDRRKDSISLSGKNPMTL